MVSADEMASLFGSGNVRKAELPSLSSAQPSAIERSLRFLAEVGLPREMGSFTSTNVERFVGGGSGYYRIGCYDGQSTLCLDEQTAKVVDLIAHEDGVIVASAYVNRDIAAFAEFLYEVQKATVVVHRFYEGEGPALDQSAFLSRLEAVDKEAMIEGAWWRVLLEDMLLSAE